MKQFSLIQLYFVLATLVGLILIIIGSVTLVKTGLDQVVGVKPYPDFTAPYPPTEVDTLRESATESQSQALAEWEAEYARWQEELQSYNSQEQQIKRDIAQALAMLLVGVPVFLIHSPRVFKKSE